MKFTFFTIGFNVDIHSIATQNLTFIHQKILAKFGYKQLHKDNPKNLFSYPKKKPYNPASKPGQNSITCQQTLEQTTKHIPTN